MTNNIRMSRISHPRATLWAMLLLAVVFLGFGMWAEACLPDNEIAVPTQEQNSPTEHSSWIRDLIAGL